MGSEPAGLTPEATATFVQVEIEKWTKVVRTVGFKLE
jgi:tripartite-type tricarboxylate transporter receptor subunit TctC